MQSVRQWSLQHYKMDPVNYCKHKILLTMHYSVISNVLNARNVFLALWFEKVDLRKVANCSFS